MKGWALLGLGIIFWEIRALDDKTHPTITKIVRNSQNTDARRMVAIGLWLLAGYHFLRKVDND